ncbi:MAG: asparagine synthase [Methanomicrobiales archaeon]|nr:asparagine synthase [Methanomicrobiales archaeon]
MESIRPGTAGECTLTGWVELDGELLFPGAVFALLGRDPSAVTRFGGEFLIRWNGCTARDHFGIIPGPCPPGAVLCDGKAAGEVVPDPPACDLAAAIEEAVRLRSGEGIVALSGGVDSALVAALAGLPCLAVGVPGAHDTERAARVAAELGLPLDILAITPRMVEEALHAVVPAIPDTNPVNVSIAATLYWVAARAADLGHTRILTGQGADELFGGYARYLESADLAADLDRDFAGLALQAARDQAVAKLHRTYFSMPYLDIRVVRAARALPAGEKVRGGMRKVPLRRAAEGVLPREYAWYDKKAMQYGSGVWKVIRTLARENGYKKSVQGYINQIVGEHHGNPDRN